MCNDKLCAGKTDYCCSKKDLNCGWWNKGRSNGVYFGGIRPCGNVKLTCQKNKFNQNIITLYNLTKL